MGMIDFKDNGGGDVRLVLASFDGEGAVSGLNEPVSKELWQLFDGLAEGDARVLDASALARALPLIGAALETGLSSGRVKPVWTDVFPAWGLRSS